MVRLIALSLLVAAATAALPWLAVVAAAPGTSAISPFMVLAANGDGPDAFNDQHSIYREYQSLVYWQVGLLVLMYFIWVRTIDWINRDSQIFNLGYARWNAIAFFVFLGSGLIAFLAPFVVGFPGLLVAWLGVFVTYAVLHNRSVQEHQKVFTPSWWRYWFAGILGKLGMNVQTEAVAEYEKGAAVDLDARGGATPVENNANLLKARQSPGYVMLKDFLADLAHKRATHVMLDFAPQAVAQKFQIDGVWHNGEMREREPSDVMLAVAKTLANLDMNERRKKQIGELGAKYEKAKYTCHLTCQGTKTGERAIFHLIDPKLNFESLEELGMRDKLSDKWLALMGLNQGLLVFSALPGGGLTTLIDTSIHETDRLMRDWSAVEDKHHPERELENVDQVTYDSAAGQTPATVLPALIRKYPDVYVVRDLVNAETGDLLIREVPDERLVIVSTRARDAAESMLRLLQLGISQEGFASVVSAAIHTRLIRKLCDQCKVGYAPTADVLKKLGIPQGRVQALYRTPRPEEIDKPCPQCGGVGFFGQTGIFELLEVNDQVRQVLKKQPKLELLKKAARNAGMRTLQEEGILLVAKGVTSLPELTRVLKL